MRKLPFLTVLRILVLLCAIVCVPSCRKGQNEKEQKPLTEKDTQRGFTQKTANAEVEMPEEVVYVKDDVNQDVLDYNPETGTISFQNSEELERQNIKAGDILYSAERTDKAPSGYSLRVTGVSRQGDKVTYQTEPASLLEVFDHLEETGTLKVGALKPEDITVYSYTSYGGDEEKTKSLDISTEGGIENFSTSTNETSFDWVFYKRTSSSNPSKVVFQAKMGITIQHEPFEDKSSILIDTGHMVLFSMMKVGATVSVTFETVEEVSETESLLEWSNVKNDLLDKKIDAVIVPIVLGWGNAIVNPSIVLSFQFGLDVAGNFTVEAGFKDEVMAFNVENVGYFVPEFFAKSYIRSVSQGHPEFRIKSEAEVNAYISVGPGLRLEFPALPIKEDGKWTFSHLGAYALGTLRGKANVNFELDPLSGGMSVNTFGSGEVALQLALQGKIGFTKLVSGDIDARYDVFSGALGEWNWSFFMDSPTPYNLNTNVDGDKATFIWDSQPTGMMSTVYDIYVDVGEGYVLYQAAWKQKSFVYNAEKDGVYRWKVTARTGNGREYPCAQEQEFTVATTTLKTLEPEIDAKHRKVVVPVSFNTRNQVISYGVAFSEKEDFSGKSEEIGGTGIGYKFSAEHTLPDNKDLYARGYMTIKTLGRSTDDQYKKLYGNVVKIATESAEPTFRLSESTADFNSVEIGQTGQVTRTVYNDGASDLVISSVTCPEGVFTPSWKSATIKSDEHKDITITFQPTEAKQYKADMKFVCNAGNADAAVLELTGTGTAQREAKVKVSKTFLEFEDTQVGKTSTLDWTITNIGNATLKVSSLTVPSGFSTDFSSWSGKSLEPNESHTFKVTFKPTKVKSYSGEMVFKSNAVNAREHGFPIDGKGVAAAGEARISMSPNTVQFGNTAVGQTAEQTVTITNKGNAPLEFTSITSSNSAFSTDFSKWSSKSLAAGSSCKLKVFFKPSAARSYSTSISIKTNAANAPDVALPVSGTGVKATNDTSGAVDLGLSVKWATCNVGASRPEEHGDFFAWGETAPKDKYSWSNYKWCNEKGRNGLTKYNTDPERGVVDNKTVLELKDDAAYVNLGKEWRMPTIEEAHEIVDNCSWNWETLNGVEGYRVTSKKNGNSIFLPTTGLVGSNGILFNDDIVGSYWSSSLTETVNSGAETFGFQKEKNYVSFGYSERDFGRAVRGVRK